MADLSQDEDLTVKKIREQNAYKYLCYLEEARIWASHYLDKQLPEASDFEGTLRDGVVLAKISSFFEPLLVPKSKIFDYDQSFYHENRGLHFRHTDNINHFLRFLQKIGLPSIFFPETTDIYDRKNMPKCIFCLHALIFLLHKKGLAKSIDSLYGVATFTDDQLNKMCQQLDNVDLPNFAKISGIISQEDEILAVIADINEALLNKAGHSEVFCLMSDPRARLSGLVEKNSRQYYNNLVEKGRVEREDLEGVIESVNERQLHYEANVDSAVVVQSVVVALRMRSLQKKRISFLDSLSQPAEVLQRFVRMVLASLPFFRRMGHFEENVDKVRKIQGFVRGRRAKEKFARLLYGENPPFSVVREFVHLLEMSEQDYLDETQLQQLRIDIVRMMNCNQQLQAKIDSLDTEAGLLIRNKMSQIENQKPKKLSQHKTVTSPQVPKKEIADMLDLIGKVIYVMQTSPTFFCRLLKHIQQKGQNMTKARDIILTCFNYGTHKREQYLLTKFVGHLLSQEMSGDDCNLINNVVMDTLVQIVRGIRFSDGRIKDFVESLLSKILQSNADRIKSDPLMIYKNYVFEKETEEGVLSGLQYNIPVEEALKLNVVMESLEWSFHQIANAADHILEGICAKISVIPYALRYLAKLILQSGLEDKWNAISNIVYWRYINVAIVVPESYGAFTSSIEGIISGDQRYNLAEFGRIMQILASGGGPDEACAAYHFDFLEDFFTKWRPKFHDFLLNVCDVEDPEEHFKVDRFMDARLLSPPQISINAYHLIEFYNMVDDFVKNCNVDEKFVELLRSVGQITALRLTGYDDSCPESFEKLMGTDHVVTLRDPFDGMGETMQQAKFIECKIMLCTIMSCQWGSCVEEILEVPANPEEEDRHKFLAMTRKNIAERSFCVAKQNCMTLEEMKAHVVRETLQLAHSGFIKGERLYDAYVREIAMDIRNKRKCAEERKREIEHIRETLLQLGAKRDYKEGQLDYYGRYIDAIVSSQSKKSKKQSLFFKGKPGVVKYSGAKLAEKGVLLGVNGLDDLRKLQLVIEEGDGGFIVTGYVMGVAMNSSFFTLQSLLELQRAGIGTVVFDRANCNVNLLIHLINKKFY